MDRTPAHLRTLLGTQVGDAARCARQARDVACARGDLGGGMCGAPIFVTSNSYRVLRYATWWLGRDARWADSPHFGFHSGPGTGHLPPLLEAAVLSASAIIIGSAGSSYPLEAANLGNTSAIVKDFGLYHACPKPHIQATLQGECGRPPPATASGSVLLPSGSCK